MGYAFDYRLYIYKNYAAIAFQLLRQAFALAGAVGIKRNNKRFLGIIFTASVIFQTVVFRV